MHVAVAEDALQEVAPGKPISTVCSSMAANGHAQHVANPELIIPGFVSSNKSMSIFRDIRLVVEASGLDIVMRGDFTQQCCINIKAFVAELRQTAGPLPFNRFAELVSSVKIQRWWRSFRG